MSTNSITLTDSEIVAAATAIYEAVELAIRGDGKCRPFIEMPGVSQHKWIEAAIEAFKAVNSKRRDNERFRRLAADLERLDGSGLTHDDMARDLLLNYEITPKPEVEL